MPRLRDVFNRSALKKGVDRDLLLSAGSGSPTIGPPVLITPPATNSPVPDAWDDVERIQVPDDAPIYIVRIYIASGAEGLRVVVIRDEAHWNAWWDAGTEEADEARSAANATTHHLLVPGGYYLAALAPGTTTTAVINQLALQPFTFS